MLRNFVILLVCLSNLAPCKAQSDKVAPNQSDSSLITAQILVSARIVVLEGDVGYTAFYGRGMPTAEKAKESLEKEIRDWGRFTIVDEPSIADLVLVMFEGNRSYGASDIIRTARLEVYPASTPRRRGDIPLWRASENGSSILPTSAAPKVARKLRAFLEDLDKNTPPLSKTESAARATPEDLTPLPPRPEKYANPIEIIARAKTYTIRGHGGEGTQTVMERFWSPKVGGRSEADMAAADIQDQMQAWGRMQYVEEVPRADIVLEANQWDVNAGFQYLHQVKAGIRVAEGGVAYQRSDPDLWTSGTQPGYLHHLIDLLRFDVEQYENKTPAAPSNVANEDYQRAVKLIQSAMKKKYEGDRDAQLGEAIMELRRSLRTDYAYAPAHFQLGEVLYQLGYYSNAVYEYRLAMQLQPGMPGARQALVAALREIPDRDEALKAAQDQTP
jgi:hypothetical protein